MWIVLYKIAAVYKQNLENVKYHKKKKNKRTIMYAN